MTIRLVRVAPAYLAGLLMTLGLACSSGKDDDTNVFHPEKDSGTDTGATSPPVSTPPKDAGVDARTSAPDTGPGTPPTPKDASPEAAAPLPLEHAWTFDTNDAETKKWIVGYGSPGSLATPTGARLEHDPADGFPTPGSLKATIPFIDNPTEHDAGFTGNQKVNIALALDAQYKDLTGKTLTARVKLDSGLTSAANTSTPGGAKLYAKWGSDFVWADGGWTNLSTSDGWVELTLNVSTAMGPRNDAGVLPSSDIREIGVEISTGGTGVVTGWTTAIVHLDTIGWR